ncbi:anti-sigma F factor antagonist, partial [Clostridioides difficile]
MVNYSLEHKNLYIEFMCSELDHHVANEIREEIDNLLSVNQVKNVV